MPSKSKTQKLEASREKHRERETLQSAFFNHSLISKSKLRRNSASPSFRNALPYFGPQIPMNAFQCFLQALGNKTTKQAKAKWNNLSNTKKDKYLAMAKLDHQRFDVEMELVQLRTRKKKFRDSYLKRESYL